MQDKRKSAPTNQEQKETSTIEKIEQNAKSNIFNVLYLLLKDQDITFWRFLVIQTIVFFQILNFTFQTNMNYPWKGDGVLWYIQKFLSFFHFVPWLNSVHLNSYLAIFAIAIFAVVFLILNVVLVSYSQTRKRFNYNLVIRNLRIMCWLFITIKFIPLLTLFTSMLVCVDGHHFIFTELQCWTGNHILYAFFAIFASILQIGVCLIISLTFYKSRNSSNDPTARVNSRSDTFMLLQNTILVYLCSFAYNSSYQWFIIVLLNILSITSYFKYSENKPYYNQKVQKIFELFTALYMWGNFVLLIAKMLENAQFNGAIQLYFLGIPLVFALVFFAKDTRIDLLNQNLSQFQKGDDIVFQIRYFLMIALNKEQDRNFEILLKGFIYQHEDQCPNQQCHLKQFKTSLIENRQKNKKSSIKKHIQMNQTNESVQLLLLHAKNMYRIAIQKFPTCTSLRLGYSFFLLEFMNKKQEALIELTHAEQYNPSFDEQFIIFRYKRLSDEYGDHMNDHQIISSGGLDIASKFAYDQLFRQFSNQVQKSAQLHLDFWSILRDERPDIGKLNECGFKINNSITIIEQLWNSLQKLSSNVPKTLKLYAKYLNDILNDKESGSELLTRYKDTINTKQNFLDLNGLIDENEISQMTQDGTPCVVVSGDTEKYGQVVQCNAGAVRVFGFTSYEIKNHNIEKLMPEMYARYHSKVFDEALAKGPDNISNKERLIFARHKSGYIFPLWFQIKTFQTANQGIQFVGLFKLDKKLISSNISYVLFTKDKKIQGISSSAMRMLELDIHKIRKLNTSGIDITKLAPNLFRDDHTEFMYQQKQGAELEWHIPDFQKKKQIINQQKQDIKQYLAQGKRMSIDLTKDPNLLKKQALLTDKKLNLNCTLNIVTMGDIGQIGWYLKLEQLSNSYQKIQLKDKERLKQPLFQFRYDSENGKFVREIKDNIAIHNANKDPNFINGEWVQMISGNYTNQPLISSRDVPSQNDFGNKETIVNPKEIVISVSNEEVKEPEKFINLNMTQQKLSWGKGIQIYTLTNGIFRPKDYDEEIKKEKQAEEERLRKIEREEKSLLDLDQMKNNIKSRKTLHLAINQKTSPSAIRNLGWTMNLVVLSLLCIAIVQYTVIRNQFLEINENFNLIQQSYRITSEIQRVAYDVRSIILINENLLTNYQHYTTTSNFSLFLLEDMQLALNSIYGLQNNISLSKLSMSDTLANLTNQKLVELYFLQTQGGYQVLNFSLTESVLQIASSIFTVQYMSVSLYHDTQEDVFFLTYNIFNQFLSALNEASQQYTDGLQLRSHERGNLLLTLFLISLGTNLFAIAILFPVVNSVNKTREQVLHLFIEVPNHHIVDLVTSCENFLNNFHDDQADEMESTDGINIKQQEAESNQKRNLHKAPKNSSKSSRNFFVQFGTTVLVIMAYFAAMYVISYDYIKNIQVISLEMQTSAELESYFTFAQNTQREMIYNKSKPIYQQNSFGVAQSQIASLYNLTQNLLTQHQANRNILSSQYINYFKNIFYGDLCSNIEIPTTISTSNCSNLISNSATQGLEVVLVRYFETLRETLSLYIDAQENGQNVKSLFDSQQFYELFLMQFGFIQITMRGLVDLLQSTVNSDFQSISNIRLAAFIIFIIGIIIGYLILWLPFVSRLNTQIWKTKSMLTIIPIEIITKIPKIQEILNSQQFFTKSKKTSA